MYIISNILINILMWLVLILLIIYIIASVSEVVYKVTLRYETFPSTAMVFKKEYEKEHSSKRLVMSGPFMASIPEEQPAKFKVYVMYGEKEHCLNSENLYNSVNLGDEISILVHEGYNKANELKYLYLSIGE